MGGEGRLHVGFNQLPPSNTAELRLLLGGSMFLMMMTCDCLANQVPLNTSQAVKKWKVKQ